MIDRAVEILRAGGLVAFPTETVYGLGADARNPAAVAKIFAAKGRPATNPLIVHVADLATAKTFARDWPRLADRLAEAFWPGPLTLVVKKSESIVDAVTAGGSTVGLRVPNHPVALDLLRAFAGPIAAPSANRSNRISPTTAAHVRSEFGDAIGCILDGGPCEVGIESTVLDLTRDRPTILRPGGISRGQIETVIGPVYTISAHLTEDETANSPGQQMVHYSPAKPTYWITPTTPVSNVNTGRTVWIAFRRDRRWGLDDWFEMPRDVDSYSRRFYRDLRLADEKNVDRILIELPPDLPEWTAIRDRILRAARPLPEADSSLTVTLADTLSDAAGSLC